MSTSTFDCDGWHDPGADPADEWDRQAVDHAHDFAQKAWEAVRAAEASRALNPWDELPEAERDELTAFARALRATLNVEALRADQQRLRAGLTRKADDLAKMRQRAEGAERIGGVDRLNAHNEHQRANAAEARLIEAQELARGRDDACCYECVLAAIVEALGGDH